MSIHLTPLPHSRTQRSLSRSVVPLTLSTPSPNPDLAGVIHSSPSTLTPTAATTGPSHPLPSPHQKKREGGDQETRRWPDPTTTGDQHHAKVASAVVEGRASSTSTDVLARPESRGGLLLLPRSVPLSPLHGSTFLCCHTCHGPSSLPSSRSSLHPSRPLACCTANPHLLSPFPPKSRPPCASARPRHSTSTSHRGITSATLDPKLVPGGGIPSLLSNSS